MDIEEYYNNIDYHLPFSVKGYESRFSLDSQFSALQRSGDHFDDTPRSHVLSRIYSLLKTLEGLGGRSLEVSTQWPAHSFITSRHRDEAGDILDAANNYICQRQGSISGRYTGKNTASVMSELDRLRVQRGERELSKLQNKARQRRESAKRRLEEAFAEEEDPDQPSYGARLH
ncbi:hypothetical protein J6590_006310 [Homalodisca vitripennis]|nr:hypothetical protein J6590_006310 [Homalodisca vitripennis]